MGRGLNPSWAIVAAASVASLALGFGVAFLFRRDASPYFQTTTLTRRGSDWSSDVAVIVDTRTGTVVRSVSYTDAYRLRYDFLGRC